DKIIVIAYATFSEAELENYKPTVVLVDDKNNIELITHELEGGKYV
ncbi:aspartate 1-decarboxylase, partial [Aliarcobacter butzleri]